MKFVLLPNDWISGSCWKTRDGFTHLPQYETNSLTSNKKLDSNLECSVTLSTVCMAWWVHSNISTNSPLHSSKDVGNWATKRSMSEQRKRPLFSLFSNSGSPSTTHCLAMVTIAWHSCVVTCGRTVSRLTAAEKVTFPTPRQQSANKEGSKYREEDATAVISVSKVVASHRIKLCSKTVASRQLYQCNRLI